MPLNFAASDPLTLGAELELQLLNRETLELSPSSPQVLKVLRDTEFVRGELFQSMVEVTTEVCADAMRVGQDIRRGVSRLVEACNGLNLDVASAGIHPLAKYEDAILFPSSRYKDIIEKRQWIARRLMIFGLHVHVGMRSGEHAIKMINALCPYLPLLLALSASSPFCYGVDTNLASARTTFFEALPTGGQPCTFESWEEFQSAYYRLLQTGAVSCPKDLWWDIRPSPAFGTIEIRLCDSPATIKEMEAIVALIHLLCSKLDTQIAGGAELPPPPSWLARENKWRAVRMGVHANFIIGETGETLSVMELLNSLLTDLRPLIASFGYEKQAHLLRQIVANGSSSDRQRKLYRHYKSFKPVLNSLVYEFKSDDPDWSFKKGGWKCA